MTNPQPTKFCVHCKYFIRPECNNPIFADQQEVDPVFGKIIYPTSEFLRRPDGACGTEAKGYAEPGRV